MALFMRLLPHLDLHRLRMYFTFISMVIWMAAGIVYGSWFSSVMSLSPGNIPFFTSFTGIGLAVARLEQERAGKDHRPYQQAMLLR